MNVFISWSGDLSRAIAVELDKWLPMAVHHVKTWISNKDIKPGQRWARVLEQELARSDFAILCLTGDNLQAPWILFEAGAVARSLGANVVPLLFGIPPSDLEDPLAQFQSLAVDKNGIKQLVIHLHEASESGLNEGQQTQVFDGMWPIFEDRLTALEERARQTKDVESPSDLVSTFVGPTARLPESEIDPTAIIQLDQEHRRLKRELTYLESEDEKLSRQDAPISLVERAIIPTKKRIEETENSAAVVLQKTFKNLTPEQVEIMRGLVTPSGKKPLNIATVPLQAAGDIEVLKGLGLVDVDEQGIMITQGLVSDVLLAKQIELK